MSDLSRSQVIVYGAVAMALLFVGARAIKAEGSSGGSNYAASSGGSYSSSSGSSSSSSSAGFSVSGGGHGDVVVDVTGAVGRPGVYRLPSGSRVNDAVKRAGGATGKARLEAVNLAARLADGQQVVVPEAEAGGAVAAAGAGEEAGPISLGTTTAAQLDTIDGIGPVTAQKIVEFREQQGGLSSVDQLDQISGIGPATMQSLRARLQP